jgi:hypothetical protein
MKISYDLLNKDEVIMQASPLDEGILIDISFPSFGANRLANIFEISFVKEWIKQMCLNQRLFWHLISSGSIPLELDLINVTSAG